MVRHRIALRRAAVLPALLCLAALPALAQGTSFESASQSIRAQLDQAVADLAAQRARMAEEKLPLARQLASLEAELVEARAELLAATREYEDRTLALSNLTTSIEKRREEASYLTNLFGDYQRNFESRLHRVEEQRYADVLEAATLAPERPDLSQADRYRIQTELLAASFGRLEDALDGSRFAGHAVVSSGLVADGQVLLVGPTALFRSDDGLHVGVVEERLGSVEPNVFALELPENALAAAQVAETGEGLYVLDPTLGNALKIEATEQTFRQEFEAGGPVMWPIFAMAAAGLLVAFFKWLGFLTVRSPSRRRFKALLEAVAIGDEEDATQLAGRIRGPVGRMLRAGVAHLREPRELIEEVMFETVLVTRLKLQRFLPFISICAASAPLLGLLGTVTGIINTFAMITVYGSGDVKTLSGGISEALITTKWGLIVAIPALLLHALLARKAKGIVNQMETSALAFVNQVARSPFGPAPAAEVPSAAHGNGATGHAGHGHEADALRKQLREALTEILVPHVERRERRRVDPEHAESTP